MILIHMSVKDELIKTKFTAKTRVWIVNGNGFQLEENGWKTQIVASASSV